MGPADNNSKFCLNEDHHNCPNSIKYGNRCDCSCHSRYKKYTALVTIPMTVSYLNEADAIQAIVNTLRYNLGVQGTAKDLKIISVEFVEDKF